MKKKRSMIVLALLVLALPVVLFSCTSCGLFGGNNDNDDYNDNDETEWWGDHWHDFVTDAQGNRVTDAQGNFVTRAPQSDLDGYRFVTDADGHRVTDNQGNYLVYPPNGQGNNPTQAVNQGGGNQQGNQPGGNQQGNQPGGNQQAGNTTTTTRPPTTTATTTTTTTTTIPVQNVSIGPASMSSLPVGGSGQVTATVTPPNATNRTVEFRSDNPTVATVNPSTGQVSAVNPGNTTIRAYIDGVRQASMPVTVNPVVNIVGPSTVADGGTITLQARDQNNNLHSAVTWSANPTDWVTITPGSGTVAVLGRRPAGWTGGSGQAVVTATVTVNGVSTTSTHTVTITG